MAEHEEPDPEDSTAEEIVARGEEAAREGEREADRARKQADQILAESEERVEDPATTDPHDDSVIRRRSEEIAD
jgi:hypothetical protein